MSPYHGDDDDDATGSACRFDVNEVCDDTDNGDELEQRINLDNFDELRSEPPILTSPRSIEACRMQGIEPEDLIKRPLEFFFTHSVHTRSSTAALANDPALAEKRAARYEKTRQVQLRNARAQRHELIDAGLHGVHGGMSLYTRSFCRSPVAAKFSMSRHDAYSSSAQQEFTVIEREKKEVERMQQRQVAEMQQLLAFELKMAELHDERERKECEKRRQEELLTRERTRRQRESDELKRRRELEKAEQHKLDLEAARREAQVKQTEARRKEQRARADDERRRREVQQAEKERLRRQEEQRLQAECAQLTQAREATKKEQEIARRDERRRQQLEHQKRLKALEVSEKQQRNKLRITSVLQDKELQKALQQEEAARKQQLSEERRQQFEDERRLREEELRDQAKRKQESIELVQQQLTLREQHRRERFMQQERDAERRLQMREREKAAERESQRREEQRQENERRRAYERMEQQLRQKQEAYLSKAEEKAVVTQLMLEHKRQSVRARLQDAKLREEEIHVALERKQKQDAYRTELLLSHIESDNERARVLKAQRESLLRRRQQIKQSASRQKQEILDSFYRMKVTKKFELPKHLAASLSMRPQSANVLQTRSLTDRTGSPSSAVYLSSGSGGTWPSKASAKRPASAIGRPASAANWKSLGERPPLHRRHSDADVLEDGADIDASETSRAREHAANAKELDDAILRAEVDTLRRKHNEELLAVLEQEHYAEEQREHLVRQARDASEKARIESIFNKERALASERIMKLTQRHERALAARMSELQGEGETGR